MPRINALTNPDYQEIEVMGKPALFSNCRIIHASVPAGLHLYEIRHSDDDDSVPVEIGKAIFVNFFGSIITTEPIEATRSCYREISSNDINFDGKNNCKSVDEFIKTYVNKKTK